MSEKHFKRSHKFDSVEKDNFKEARPKKGVLEPSVFSYYQRCNQILNKENEFENEAEKGKI